VLSSAVTDIIEPCGVGTLNLHHAGCWECDLTDNLLTWSGGVYDIFGLPRNARISRREAVAFYCEESRAKMERLRSHSIKHRRGFTVDVEIRAAVGENRWMRLIAAPVCEDGRPVRLRGLKLII
jgi:PAS domain-containing protein